MPFNRNVVEPHKQIQLYHTSPLGSTWFGLYKKTKNNSNMGLQKQSKWFIIITMLNKNEEIKVNNKRIKDMTTEELIKELFHYATLGKARTTYTGDFVYLVKVETELRQRVA